MRYSVQEEHLPSERKKEAEEKRRPLTVKKWLIGDKKYSINVSPEGEYKLLRLEGRGRNWREIETDTNFRRLEKKVQKEPDPDFYHGTNHESAKQVLKEGLKTDKTGSNFTDSSAMGRFDSGVYITTNPRRAAMWSQDDKVTDVEQAPVVLEIDSSYIDEEKLEEDVKAPGLGDRIYADDIPAEAISVWSIDPFDEGKVRACADVFDRTYHINTLNASENQETVDEFENKCEMPFNRP